MHLDENPTESHPSHEYFISGHDPFPSAVISLAQCRQLSRHPPVNKPCLTQGSSISCCGVGDVSKGPQDGSLILALVSLEDARSWGETGVESSGKLDANRVCP